MTASSPSVKQKPPGPKPSKLGLPLVGEMKKDTLGFLLRLREEHGDTVCFRILNQSIYVLFSPELIREALVTHASDFVRHERVMDVFTLVYGANVMTTEGETWVRQRRMLNPGFTPKRVAGYSQLIADAATDSIASALDGDAEAHRGVDVDRFMTRLTMDVILRVLFSFKASDEESNNIAEAVRSLEHQCVRELMWPVTPPDWFPFPGRAQKRKAKALIDNFIRGQIRHRRLSIEDYADKTDYLAMLLDARDEQAQKGASSAMLTDDEIHDNCAVIFAAGHDTTAASLTWWVGLMAEYPEYADKVRQEIEEEIGDKAPSAEELTRLKWLNATIKETMRICPAAVSLFNRRAIRDVQVGEWHIPKNATVGVPIWHVHHDARWYPEPEKFRPERFLPGATKIPRGAYFPFGAGPHVCIGQHLVMLEMAQICSALLRKFNFEFLEGESLPKPKIEMLLKPETPLTIKFIAR